MRRGPNSVGACFVLAALAACSGGGSGTVASSEPTTAPSGTVGEILTTPTTTEPEPLTHAQFIKRLDHLCRKFNRRDERRFSAKENAAAAANDYERLADLYQQSNRLNRPFYPAVLKLRDRVPEEDAAGLSRYLSLSHERDIYFLRYIRALRQHDDDELTRLSALIDRTRNQRTRVTAKMGLRVCGS